MQELNQLREKINNMSFLQLAEYIQTTVMSPEAEARLEKLSARTGEINTAIDNYEKGLYNMRQNFTEAMDYLQGQVNNLREAVKAATTEVE